MDGIHLKRKTYKASHSAWEGGHVYIHRTGGERIGDKKGLYAALSAALQQPIFLDPSVKIYSNVFLVFFALKHTAAPQTAIDLIQKAAAPFACWDSEYIFENAYDMQEPYVRAHLKSVGLDPNAAYQPGVPAENSVQAGQKTLSFFKNKKEKDGYG